MARYGHEISDTIIISEADFVHYCKLEKPNDFIGKAALLKQKEKGIERILVGLEMIERGIARDDYKVLDDSGNPMGYVTSGSPAPFLKMNVALAYVPPKFSEIGT